MTDQTTAIDVRGDDDGVAWLARILGTGTDGTGSPAGHAVVPPRGDGRFLVPLDPRAAAASLTAFNRLRPGRTRLVRAGLAAGIRLGFAGPLLARRVALGGAGADHWLPAHLAEVLGEPDLVFATGLRTGDTFAKPVLQLFRSDGTPLAYAKVGWNAVTVPRVRAEARALDAWRGDLGAGLAAPRLLHAGEWADRFVAVTAPLPASARRLSARDAAPALAALAVAVSGPTRDTTLGASPYWAELTADAARLAPTPARSAPALQATVERIGARHGATTLRCGRWHGDWVTWNLARADGRLWAWDWEYSDADVPVGLDIVHHLFQEAFVGRGVATAPALADAAAGARELLAAAGLPVPAVEAVIAVHRAELLRRDAAAEELGGTPDPRLDRAALAAESR